MKLFRYILAAALAGGGMQVRAERETFDYTGLSASGTAWTAAGDFTGTVEGVTWTYANGRGGPVMEEGNPAFCLRGGGTAAQKGWLRSSVITGGVGRVSMRVMKAAAASVDVDVWAGEVKLGNFKGSAGTGVVESAMFLGVDSNRYPVTNACSLMVSNRVSASGSVTVDDLEWEPFQLYVRLDRTGTNTIATEREWDVRAEVFSRSAEAVAGVWSVEPAFAGTVGETNSPDLTLIPAFEDAGKVFRLTYQAQDGEGTVAEAVCWVGVSDELNPRRVDFEDLERLDYNTSGYTPVTLKGMVWRCQNARKSQAADAKMGAVSLRCQHGSEAFPAVLESQDAFPGVGTISLHYACFQTNRTVKFELQARGDGEEWQTLEFGQYSSEGVMDITNGFAFADVNRSDDVWVRVVTTGNVGEIMNLDELYIRPARMTLPRVVCASGPSMAVMGEPSAWEFEVRNRGTCVWTNVTMTPTNARARFEVLEGAAAQWVFEPGAEDFGEYTVTAEAWADEAWVGATTVAFRVVSAPGFELAMAETNVTVGDEVRIWTTNVTLNGGGTNWSTVWSYDGVTEASSTYYNRFNIVGGEGLDGEDVGERVVTAVLTDAGTGLSVTGRLAFTVGPRTDAEVRAPEFTLLPSGTATVVVPAPVDIRTTNVTLDVLNTKTNFTTRWQVDPPFESTVTTSNRSRFYLSGGTAAGDVGTHVVTAVLMDKKTGLSATNVVTILVVTNGDGGDISGEVYEVTEFVPDPEVLGAFTLTLRITNQAVRVFTPFALDALEYGAEVSNRVWMGERVTNATAGDLQFILPAEATAGAAQRVFGVAVGTPE